MNATDRKILIALFVEAHPGCTRIEVIKNIWRDYSRDNRQLVSHAYRTIQKMVKRGELKTAVHYGAVRLYRFRENIEPPF